MSHFHAIRMKAALVFFSAGQLGWSAYSFAQESDAAKWFPYHIGDMWEYWQSEGVSVDTCQIVNVAEAPSAGGIVHLIKCRRLINPTVHDPYLDTLRYLIDTSASEVFQPFAEPVEPPRTAETRFLKFNAQRGDQWVVYDYRHAGSGGFEMARVVARYDGGLFGRNTTFMQVHYYGAADSLDTSGISRKFLTLAKGLGIIEDISSEPGYSRVIKGAVIDGVVYGDTTSILVAVRGDQWPDAPQIVELYQNYPNPFNPTTTIRFHLANAASLSLIIHDLMGREVRRLIDDKSLWSGIHEIVWDGKNGRSQYVAGGVYYCRAMAGGRIATRTMIFLK